jgi:predicted dehydrogenase
MKFAPSARREDNEGHRSFAMKVTPSTRRQFIKSAAAAITTFNVLPRHVLGGAGFVPPSEKVNVAMIGVGGQGTVNLRALFALDDVQVIAIADPAESFGLEEFYYHGRGGRKPALALVEEHYSSRTPNYRCREFEDFRVMLERERAIDAVLIATPDHHHAHQSIVAMRAGKHVYCEKPLTHNLWEGREVARVARETGVATQMGNAGHSKDGIRETVEHVRAGTIGTVRDAYAWVPAPRWNPSLTTAPTDTPPVPAGLNWDLWLGPREVRPFHPAYFPVRWRDFWAFGTSGMGDFGCHDLDAIVWAFDLPTPSRVEAYPVGVMDHEIAPHGSTIYFDFPAQADRPPLRVTWHDGGGRPRAPEALGRFPLPERGVMFVGSQGVIQCDGGGSPPRIFPGELRAATPKPPELFPRSKGHHRDWIDACKGGRAASSHFGVASHLTEITNLGVLSLRLRQPIEWDARTLSVPGQPAAEPIIRGTYRRGWEIV